MLRRESSWDSNSSGRAYHIKKKKNVEALILQL